MVNGVVRRIMRIWLTIALVTMALNGAPLENFITRSVDKLMDGKNEFRFIGFNCPNLHFNENGPWRRTDYWEMEDAFRSMAQMGGTATRCYVFSCQPNDYRATKVHYYGDGKYDEELFTDFDKMLQLADEYGVRVIVPFMDQWRFWGGVQSFANINGGGNFYTTPLVIERYKNFIKYILNRTNTFTGVKYKDCKSVLAWETGNEIGEEGNDDIWSKEISAFIKSIDSNHLVADGRKTVSPTALADPNMDIMDMHVYQKDYSAAFINESRSASKGKRVLIAGEFGYGINAYGPLDPFLDAVIANGTSGALIWSLRYRNKDGGYYFHSDNSYLYHWPATDASQAPVVEKLRNHAFQIRGLPVPKIPLPIAPQILSCSLSVSKIFIKFRGGTGTKNYDIERSNSSSGPWEKVGINVNDNQNPYKPFADSNFSKTASYYYRMIGKNSSGNSEPSATYGPVGNGVKSEQIDVAVGENCLLEIYPTPFNPSTHITYKVPISNKNGNLSIFSVAGDLVRSFKVDGGKGVIEWNAENENGKKVSSGVYIIKLSAGKKTIERTGVFIR